MSAAKNRSNRGTGGPKKEKKRNTGTIQDNATSKDAKTRKKNAKHNEKALKRNKKGKGGNKRSTPYI